MLCRSCSFVAPSRRELTRPQTVIRVLRMQARPPHTPGVFCTQLLVVFRFADIGRTSFDRIVPGVPGRLLGTSFFSFLCRRFSWVAPPTAPAYLRTTQTVSDMADTQC